ncbi:MAG: L,D-transpeptidase, partial [Acidimicrobiia bacterium]|nr:L,D-transpeptidase [Acidimicrobiia bacterium]
THDGPEVAPLGTLYRPLYFTGGWALHGSLDVPAYPASHGCVRLSYADTDWLWQYAGEGTAVEVFETMSPEVLWRQEIIDDTEPYLAAHPDEATVTNLSAA